MYKMKKRKFKKFKRKIYRKYEDYFDPAELPDQNKQSRSELSINDFNARGELANPRAPCVVTSIDPDYIKDASTQRLRRKFRMKTDILRLREITRNKFMYYATQEMYLDRKREIEHQDRIYKEAMEFHQFAYESLKKMETDAFKEMLEAQQHLKKLKENKVAEELAQVKLAHQRVLMEVQEIYGRFLYLLKLISYFDDTVEQLDGSDEHKLTMPTEIISMDINERNPAGLPEMKLVQEYMEKVVRPYLDKRNHLNAEIWIKGYERNRRKVSNYNRRFTHLALLNHIVGILHDKAQKTFQQRNVKPIFLKNPDLLKARVEALEKRSHELFNAFEIDLKKDKQQMMLDSVITVLLKRIDRKICEDEKKKEERHTKPQSKPVRKQWRTLEDVQTNKNEESNILQNEQEPTLAKVEKIQAYVFELLGQLDNKPQNEVRAVESRVRRRLEQEKEISRQALIKQNRLNNWMEHFKKHHRLQQQDNKYKL